MGRVEKVIKYVTTNLNKLIWLVEIGHFSGAQDVVDVLQEGLVYDLSVVEQEHGGLAVHACQTVQLLDVCRRDRSHQRGFPEREGTQAVGSHLL